MLSLHELEPERWSALQFEGCALGDKRRTRRLVQYARRMAEKPDGSTPQQTETWAECKGVYRIFRRPEVTFNAVTTVHHQQTLDTAAGVCLVISDTTELDYGYKSQRKGLGRLTTTTHRGFFLHTALVVDATQGDVVGVGAQELWKRSLRKKERVRRVACRKRATEAEVWGRVMDRVVPTTPGVKLIHVCDRGADNFDVFAHLSVKKDSWVIRAAQLTRKVRYDQRVMKLSEVLKSARMLGEYQVHIAANGKQKARWAAVEVRGAQITLLRPREGSTTFVMDRNIEEIDTQVVEVREVNPPKGCEPVRWVLYTREAVSTLEQALRCIEHYEKR